MAYQTIPIDQPVNKGDKLQFAFSFFDYLYVITPTEGELATSADKAPSISISKVSYTHLSSKSILGESGTIEGIVTEDNTYPTDIMEGIKNAWTQDFKTVTGVSIDSVSKQT